MLYSTSYYQIRGKKVLKYEQLEFVTSKQKEHVKCLNARKIDTYTGEMSEISRKNIRRKMEVWYDAIVQYNKQLTKLTVNDYKQFVFVTLTLPASQRHTDEDIKRLILKPFLRKMNDQGKIENYIWKAESQENGNIHFHIVSDKYLNNKLVQVTWNKCCEKLGYVSRFFEKYHHYMPPSTHVEGFRDFEKMKEYLEKYVCKTSDYRKISGALWKGSKKVMSLQFFEFVADNEVDRLISDKVKEGKIKVNGCDRYEVYTPLNFDLIENLPFRILDKRKIYREMLIMFLFSDCPVEDFRTYCYLVSEYQGLKKVEKIEIQKKTYPAQLKIEFDNFEDLKNVKKYML